MSVTAESELVRLHDGSTVVVRPLASGDQAAISSWFSTLGAETRYARFFTWMERLDRRTQSELARVDHVDREAIAAFASDGSTIGIARFMRTCDPAIAEVAVAVADGWRGHGLARILLARVTARARESEIAHFTAMCLATNRTVIRLLSQLGPTVISAPEAGVVELSIDLSEPERDGRG